MPLPVFDNAAYEALLASRRANDRSVLSGSGGMIEARMGAIPDELSLLAARRRANQAKAGTIGAGYGVINAQRGVNAASAAVLGREQDLLGATRGVIGLQQQQAGAKQADISLIRGARDNVGDKVAVAQQGLAQGVEDQRLYGRLGVAAPVSVDVPLGQEGNLGLGTRASLRTQEDIVRGQVADREADRAATLENAKLAVSMVATNVTEAELMARRAGLSLADARLMVDMAQQQEALAGVDVSNASLATDANDLELKRLGINLEGQKLFGQATTLDINDMKAPADQGYEMYTDPVTRQRSWLTPDEANQRQFQYETSLTRQRMPTTLSLAQERQQAQQQQQVAENPFLYFDDSDFVQFLLPGIQGNAGDSSQPNFNNLVAQIRAGLMIKYRGDERTVNTKLIQYVNAAKALQAKQRDESGGLQR